MGKSAFPCCHLCHALPMLGHCSDHVTVELWHQGSKAGTGELRAMFDGFFLACFPSLSPHSTFGLRSLMVFWQQMPAEAQVKLF